MPQINGMPRVLGCPWCHVRKAGKYVPRPRIHCAACTHYVPDDVNPAGGAGHCGLKPTDMYRVHYPKQKHRCATTCPAARMNDMPKSKNAERLAKYRQKMTNAASDA